MSAKPLTAAEGISIVSHLGVENRIRLFNETTTVVLDPFVGGRVVEYALDGKDALYHAPPDGQEGFRPDAGRFDIGPEKTLPKRGVLGEGTYNAEVTGPPPYPKFGIDTDAGWLGYVTRDNLLFVKRFPTYPERPYGEIAAYTVSIWYFKDEACELEPIGPTEFLAPGESASFTEDWWLIPYLYPEDKSVDLKALDELVDQGCR